MNGAQLLPARVSDLVLNVALFVGIFHGQKGDSQMAIDSYHSVLPPDWPEPNLRRYSIWRGGYAFFFSRCCDIFSADLCILIMPKTG
jgi:hypothetical protein